MYNQPLILKKYEKANRDLQNNEIGIDGELIFNEFDSSIMMYNSLCREWKKFFPTCYKVDLPTAPPIETYSLYPILDPPRYESIFRTDEDSKYINIRLQDNPVDDSFQEEIEQLNQRAKKQKKKVKFINNEYLKKLKPYLSHAFVTTKKDEDIIIQKN